MYLKSDGGLHHTFAKGLSRYLDVYLRPTERPQSSLLIYRHLEYLRSPVRHFQLPADHPHLAIYSTSIYCELRNSKYLWQVACSDLGVLFLSIFFCFVSFPSSSNTHTLYSVFLTKFLFLVNLAWITWLLHSLPSYPSRGHGSPFSSLDPCPPPPRNQVLLCSAPNSFPNPFSSSFYTGTALKVSGGTSLGKVLPTFLVFLSSSESSLFR